MSCTLENGSYLYTCIMETKPFVCECSRSCWKWSLYYCSLHRKTKITEKHHVRNRIHYSGANDFKQFRWLHITLLALCVFWVCPGKSFVHFQAVLLHSKKICLKISAVKSFNALLSKIKRIWTVNKVISHERLCAIVIFAQVRLSPLCETQPQFANCFLKHCIIQYKKWSINILNNQK